MTAAGPARRPTTRRRSPCPERSPSPSSRATASAPRSWRRPSPCCATSPAGAGSFSLEFQPVPAGAGHYRETGESLPAASLDTARAADAILLSAMGLPEVRYPDGTEISPQIELRMKLGLFAGRAAGVRAARPGRAAEIAAGHRHRLRDRARVDRGAVRLARQGHGRRRPRSPRDPGDHPRDLGEAVRLRVPAGPAPQGGRPRQGAGALRRQGQRVPGLRVLPQGVPRACRRLPRYPGRGRLCRRHGAVDGPQPVGPGRAGDREHVR